MTRRKQTQKERLRDMERVQTRMVQALLVVHRRQRRYNSGIERINLKITIGGVLAGILGTAWFGIATAVVVKFLVN